jgi:hypothetical protein
MGAYSRILQSTAVSLACLCSVASAQGRGYEAPPLLDAGEQLGDATLQGEFFEIQRKVVNNGFMNVFTVTSDFQQVEAYGNSLALERAREQVAIAALREIKKTDAFRDGIGKAVEAPLAVGREAIRDPRRVMAEMPQGMGNLWRDATSVVKTVAKGGQDLDATAVAKDLAGYTGAKRRLAAELGVDPFSSNEVLQEDLDDVTWAIFAGGATVDLAMTQTPMAVGLSMRALKQMKSAHSSPWDIPIVTLLQASIEALQRMGLTEREADFFVRHPVCTVTQQTRLVSALADVGEVAGRDTFVRMAMGAEDETACRLHMETAELLWTYQQAKTALEALQLSGASVLAEDVAGRQVLVLRADYVAWTEPMASLADVLPAAEQRTLWLSGMVSPRSRGELERRGVRLEQRVFERHPREIDVAKILTPERGNATREDEPESQTRSVLEEVHQGAKEMIEDAR